MNVNKGIINTGRIGGDASVENREGHFGDNMEVHASNSVVNIKGRLQEVRSQVEAIGQTSAADGEVRERLDQLLQGVESVAEAFPAEAGRVVAAIDLLAKELQGKSSGSGGGFLGPTWEFLKKAVADLAAAAPAIAGLGAKLGESLGKIL